MAASPAHAPGRTLRLATRGSAQATAQASAVADALMAAHPGLEVQLVFVETLGDRRTDVPLHTMGGQGVFVKEVQRAVLAGDADFAAHSAKDLPSTVGDGLQLAAFCQRRDPRDALVGAALHALPQGATLATGSVRRRAQLQVVRPDLHFVELRGNIHTRLTKVPDGGALVMAVTALQILGLTDLIAEVLPVEQFVPAPGQGCVALECRAGDAGTAAVLAAVDHPQTRAEVLLERAFLAQLGTGCSLPVAAHAAGDVLSGFLADPDAGCTVSEAIAVDDALPADRLARAAGFARHLQQRLAEAVADGAATGDAGSR
ncbi:MAG: hydroxymethylbilane synthase [Actinomycetota bacterium]|nr:hydroxymethylbilane synthase [Actinomycetota bacterium]